LNPFLFGAPVFGELQSMPDNLWRLIATSPMTGPENMAVDEALASYETSPTIRFYQWSIPYISIGRYQNYHSIFQHGPSYNPRVPIIRRPTGGRAILHQPEELTYSITVPQGHNLNQIPSRESYKKINEALILGLSILGINATTAIGQASPRKERVNIACYESTYPHELIVGKRKLIASAQTRGGGIFLQQGTLPLKHSGDSFGESVSIGRAEKSLLTQRLNENTAIPSQILGYKVTIEEIQQALISGFETAWNIRLIKNEFGSEEHHQINNFIAEKYSDEAWTMKGKHENVRHAMMQENTQ
tara:strand:- start:763 stop:1668 length:906 start_codon:yes stop_codon:yes gene_type:complete